MAIRNSVCVCEGLVLRLGAGQFVSQEKSGAINLSEVGERAVCMGAQTGKDNQALDAMIG